MILVWKSTLRLAIKIEWTVLYPGLYCILYLHIFEEFCFYSMIILAFVKFYTTGGDNIVSLHQSEDRKPDLSGIVCQH